jgi:cytidylate kinase
MTGPVFSAAMAARSTPRPAASTRPARGIVVALDGPASSGKSSVGAAAAKALGMRFVDTGLLYRALTALALRDGIAPDDATGLVALVDRITLGDDGTGRLTRVLLDGVDATAVARSPEVDAAVSSVSRVPEVRAALMPRQRALAAAGGIVVAGRDIGTVVLPDADLKLFLDASVEERAARRIEERGLDPDGAAAAEVRSQLRARDDQDRNRAVAPLRAADDAVVLRTDGNRFEDTVGLVVAAIRDAEARARPDEPAARMSPMPAEKPAPKPGRQPNPALLERAMRLDNDRTLLTRMVALASRIGVRLFVDLHIEGLDRLPKSGGVILALNHVSNADVFVAGPWINEHIGRRRIHWLGKKELFAWPIFGRIAAVGGIHPVDRGTADVEAFRLATRILDEGFVLLAFPEGTRSPNGALQEAKDGVATLAMRTNALVVPIGVSNSDRVWPKGRPIPSPIPRHRVDVRIGEPFRVADVIPGDADRRTAKTLATRAIMGRIAELLEPRQRGVYADAVRPEVAIGKG